MPRHFRALLAPVLATYSAVIGQPQARAMAIAS
jgi:hypothetical protein